MEMFNLVAKLKSFMLELGEDLIMHLVFHLTSYTLWTIQSKLFKRDKIKNAHFVSTSQNKKRKNIKGATRKESDLGDGGGGSSRLYHILS
ncbi:hypothetical protein CR513_47939, partial [Mucuna pruriens]